MTLSASAGMSRLIFHFSLLAGGLATTTFLDFSSSSIDTNLVDPDLAMNTVESGIRPARRTKLGRRKNRPSRSVSPSNQTAGVLFRISQGSVIESVCVGSFDVSENISLAGRPLPPLTRDYGFSYAAKEKVKQDESPVKRPTPIYPPESPDALDEDYDVREKVEKAMSNSSRGRGRKTGPPTPRSCISCGAVKTPYWREAWSSTVLLCNACGLRFSKFRRRCLDCSYVPRKEDKGSKVCTKCSGPWS